MAVPKSAGEVRRLRIIGWAAAIAALLQTIGLIRYASRLPDDWIGIVFYLLTILAFTAGSVGANIQIRKRSR